MQSSRSRQSLDGRARPSTPTSRPTTPTSPFSADASIKVSCRVRPSPAPSVVSVDGNAVLVQNPGCMQDQLDEYTFDNAFDQQSTQEEIYKKVVEPVVESVLSGINGTVFCYGQTGSGKTYTMEGIEKDPGLLPRLGHSIFEGSTVPEEVSVSFVEIYMERLQDLLEPANKVEVRETMSGSVYLSNACELVVSSASEMFSCVKSGQRNRSVAATRMNERSSRSHSVFAVSVKTCDVSGLPLQGVLHFVDLAGSESAGRTGAVGQTLEQSKHINQSLLGLGRVIGALGTGQPHVPYRDSKLTRILQDSLGGSAKTSIIVNISPEAVNAYETINSLRFGQGASLVKNAPRVNLVDLTVSDLQKLLSERDAEICRLRARVVALESHTSPTKMAISISTPEKTKPESGVACDERREEVRTLFVSTLEDEQDAPAWSWKRAMIVATMLVAMYVTNPGENEEGFKSFLRSQYVFPVMHFAAEVLGFVKIDVQNGGFACLGQENSRLFLGLCGRWIELPGVWCEDRDLDVLFFGFVLLFILWKMLPQTMARHCAASFSNLRAGRLWSLVAAQLSHPQIEHLLASIFLLYTVGPQVHAALGRYRFFALFFTGGAFAILSSMLLQTLLPRRRSNIGSVGACGSLFSLIGYLHAAGHPGIAVPWPHPACVWAMLALSELLLYWASGLCWMTPLLGAAAGLAAWQWQLLELIPKASGWTVPELHLLELVPRG